MEPDDPRHGTVNGYINLSCRCDLCREAWRTYHAAYRARLAQRTDTPHGTPSAYQNWGCRCDLCREAARRGQRPVAACGTRSGYVRHRKNGEETCQQCRDAQNAYSKQRRNAAKEEAA